MKNLIQNEAQTEKLSEFFSAKEAAEFLQVTRQYIWLLIKMGKLSARKVVGRYLIPESEVERLMEKKIEASKKQSKDSNKKRGDVI